MRVRVYVDGLNFYYGLALPYNFKWVDINTLFLSKLKEIDPEAEIEKIILFSSEVIDTSQGENARIRQLNYFEALSRYYGSKIEIVLGKFQESRKKGKLTSSNAIVEVVIREEKQTDVNLACRIVSDAFEDFDKKFDIICLVSNDGDLAAPLKIKSRLKQETIVLFPIEGRKIGSREIKKKGVHISTSLKKWVKKKYRIYGISKDEFIKHRLPEEIDGVSCPKKNGWTVK